MKTFLYIFALVFFLFAFFPQQARALSNITKISNSSSDVAFPQIVTDSKGYLHVVWMEVVPEQIWTGSNPGIYYSRWNGDTWSTPLKISENTGFASSPSIAVDSTDTVHVVWDDESYAGDSLPVVVYKTRSASGIWSAIETLTRPTGTIAARFSKIAVNSSGEPNVFYTANTDGFKDSIYWTKKVSGFWSTPELVSKNASDQNIIDSQWVDVRQDTAGNIHLIYWSFGQSVFYRKYASGVWSTPFQVNTSGNMESIRLGVTPGGEVFVTWYQIFDTTINVRWTQSGVWQVPLVLTSLGQRSHWGLPIMGVTTDSKERAHVGWGEKDEGDGLIDLKYRSFASGVWGPVNDVDLNNNDADSPFVYPDKWDNQHFSWAEKNPTTGLWELMYRVAEGTIQTVPTTGGTVTANPNNVTEATLTIPNGALGATTDISLQIGPVPENVDPNQVTLPKAYTFRPNGLTFLSPATAVIQYTNAEVAGSDESLLKPWFWDSQTSAWTAQTSTNNTTANTLTVSLNHFSLYGVAAPIVNTTWHKPKENRIAKKDSLKFSFDLIYADGTSFRQLENNNELRVVLKDSQGTVRRSIKLDNEDFKRKKENFRGEIMLEQNGHSLPDGKYTLEVLLTETLLSSRNIQIR